MLLVIAILRFGLNYYKIRNRPNSNAAVETENPDDIYASVNDVYEKFYAPESKELEVEAELDEFANFPNDELIEDELKCYTQAKNCFKGRNTEDILSWWKSNSKTYLRWLEIIWLFLLLPLPRKDCFQVENI